MNSISRTLRELSGSFPSSTKTPTSPRHPIGWPTIFSHGSTRTVVGKNPSNTGFHKVPSEGDSSDQSINEWKDVRAAVEEALPFYESISEVISLGLARHLRLRAIRRLADLGNCWVLDSGTGPGVSSRMMLENGFEEIIGLDPSIILLRFAKTKLNDHFNPVLGVAENLPFRDECIAGAITCFSLRDVRDKALSVRELGRIVRKNSRLEIVDIGKPDNTLLRRLIGLYISWVMPVLARLFIGRRSRQNPFRMIIPTFHRLSTNKNLNRLASQTFGSSRLYEFSLGGLIIVEAQKMPKAESTARES